MGHPPFGLSWKIQSGSALPAFRIIRKDHRFVDPFTIREAEAIEAIHFDQAKRRNDYHEFRFFTHLRLVPADCLESHLSMAKCNSAAVDR
jgi:hypothetical protein